MNKLSQIIILLGLALFGAVLPTQAAGPGDLDPSFGTNGLVLTNLNTSNDSANAVISQPDGKVIVGGFTAYPRLFALIRYKNDGTLDPAFGDGGVVITDLGGSNDTINAVALLADGKILAAGRGGSGGDFALARYNSDGTLDPSFGTGGFTLTNLGGPNDYAATLLVQANGRIVLGGKGGSTTNAYLVRYTSAGALDTGFGTGGISAYDYGGGSTSDDIKQIVQQADGKIVAVAAAYDATTKYNFAIARYNSDGTLDPSFGTNGITAVDFLGSNDYAYGVTLQGDSKIVATGSVYKPTAPTDTLVGLARFNSDGTLDSTFGSGGKVAVQINGGKSTTTRQIIDQADGGLLVAGYSQNIASNNYDYFLARFLADGSPDASFGSGGTTLTDFGYNGADTASGVAYSAADGMVILTGAARGPADTDFGTARYKVKAGPTNPTSVTESGGAMADAWQNSVSSPAFTWSGATDGDGSGLKDYDVYWGSDPAGTTVLDTVTSAAYTPAGPVSTGTTYLRLRTRTNNDAISDWATAFIFKYDATAPTLPASATETAHGCSGWCNQLDVAFSWAAATDSDSGLAEYDVYWGSDPAGSTPTAAPADPAYDPPATDSSAHYLRLRARDNAGNESGWATLYSYQYDDTPPANPDTATTVGGLSSGGWSNAAPVFTLSGASDADSGLAGYNYYFGSNPAETPATFSPGSVITPLVSGNGAYYLRVEAVDAAGNPAGSVADLFTLRYDNTTPAAPTSAVENHSLSSGDWSNTAPVFTLSRGNDEESGLAGYVYYFGLNASGVPATFSASPVITPTLNGNGTYYLRVSTQDVAGNESGVADLFTFKYDTAAPTHPTATETHALTSAVWQNSVASPAFELSGASDGSGSGVAGYDLYWGSSAAGTTVTTHTIGSSYTPPAVTAGTHYLRGRTYDLAGNVSVWQTLFTFKYDAVAPNSPGLVSEAGGVISGTWQATISSPAFNWNASPDNSGGSGTAGYEVYWGTDPAGNTAVTQVTNPAFAPGAVTPGTPTYLRLRAYDQVGNTSPWVTAFDFRYDLPPAAPTVITETHSLTSATWQNSVAAPAFTWETVADAVSYDVYWGTESGGTTVVTTTTNTAYTPGPVANGLFYLRLRSRTARDVTSAWATAFIFKFDNTPPTQVNRVAVTETGDAPDGGWQSVTGDASFAWPVPSDALAGIAQYRVYWGIDPAGTSPHEQTSPTYDPPAIAGGTRYLRLKSYDNAGNATQWQTLFEFKYDGDPPAVTLESPPFYPAALSFDVRWAVTDATSGPANCTVSWAVASRSGYLAHNQPYNAVKTAQFFENLAGSDVGLTAICADQAGLTTVVTSTTTIVAAITDGDSDEQPDVWETANSLNPADPADAAGDPDSDELTNLQEYQHGTDPRQLDTDGDGLSDYDEVYSLWAGSLGVRVMAAATTTPILWDSDGDGLGDGLEVTLGSDPLNGSDPYDPAVDSDGDGLPDGWESYYGFDPHDPSDAAGDPDSDGLDNLGEYQRHTSPLAADTDHDGLSDGDEVNSAGTDPNAWDTDRDRFPDSMEIADATDPTDGNDSPLVSDQDHDGMNDAWETTHNISDPAADPDGDGLGNLGEYQAGTDPHLADTDRDGYTDKTEVDAGTDPLDPASTPDGPPDSGLIYLPVVIK